MANVGRTTKNVLANYAGQAFAAILGLLAVPVYLHYLGVAAYGLIGIFMALQSIMLMLDLGLGATFVRESASLNAVQEHTRLRSVFAAFEAIFLAMAIVIAVLLVTIAPLLVKYWIKASSLGIGQTTAAVALMGLAIGISWPFSLYSAGLTGLQRMLTLNLIVSGATVLRVVGSVMALIFIAPTVKCFFIVQVATSVFQTVLAGYCLRKAMPPAEGAVRVDLREIRHLARFAFGVSGATIIALFLSQADKIILSKVVSLELFGYYALANTAASSLSRLFAPISGALYPRMSELRASGDLQRLVSLYHRGCQLMTIVTVPAAVTASLFAYPLLSLWTNNAETAAATAPFLRLLMLGAAGNGLMYLPSAIQWAYNRSDFTLAANFTAAVFFVPPLLYFIPLYGGVAAAAIWFGLNLCYIFFSLPVMHRVILEPAGWSPRELWRFLWSDTVLPTLAAIAGAGLIYLVLPTGASKPYNAFVLMLAGASSLGAALAVAPSTRHQALHVIGRSLAGPLKRGA